MEIQTIIGSKTITTCRMTKYELFVFKNIVLNRLFSLTDCEIFIQKKKNIHIQTLYYIVSQAKVTHLNQI